VASFLKEYFPLPRLWIDDRTLSYPVGVLIAGNFEDVLRVIEPVGGDLQNEI
jgi:hypothetical protein